VGRLENMGLFKRKEVPAELPSLAVDVVKKVDGSQPEPPQPEPTSQSYKPLPKAVPVKKAEGEPVPEPVTPAEPQPVANPEEPKPAPEAPHDEEGYFRSLVKTVTEETEDLEVEFLV